ncbi:hypothetical protein ACFYN9_12740 [Streptomyces collinus]|uniref:Uncharacterized protein n=2 Tax=Streptomyces TaxID=1883 RepID=A0AA89Q633_STRCU|nr:MULTISPECIES: hypothetical protein [Streptomyces]MBB5814907.1 hypothetical protein [Streptomyces collinus]MEC7057788.1 hypothetical protein [Streptomyces violaceochromogenes]WMX67882.1 hypothetical protein RFN52_32820 [Streptomyces collinus]
MPAGSRDGGLGIAARVRHSFEAYHPVAAGGTDVRRFTDVHDLSLFLREGPGR